jgi:hypothetical protein
MATNNKDFKVKHGLIVEGEQGTINNQTILTEVDGDAYILDLIGGETLITSVSNEFDVTEGELSIDRTTVDAYYDTAGAAAAAQTAAEATASADATSKANAAQEAAEDYADGLAVNYDVAGAAAAAQTAAEDYADGLAVNYDVAGAAAAAQAAAEGYTDDAVAALVNGAPELLDTLNELAAAIGDDENFATTITGLVADKQDTLTAGDNIDITGATISVTGLDSADISDFNTAALSATASAYDATGTAQGIVDALTTDDIEEGSTNEYFTNDRAKVSAAEALTNATLTNITITGGGTLIDPLVITAENGVADSDTDDLEEGETNLYFTNQRVEDSFAVISPQFPAVNIASVARQVAATLEVATASTVSAIRWSKDAHRSAEFLVKIANGSHTQISKILLTLDTADNIAITEYAMVGTNDSLGSVSADINAGDARIRVTTANNTSVVTVVGTLLV